MGRHARSAVRQGAFWTPNGPILILRMNQKMDRVRTNSNEVSGPFCKQPQTILPPPTFSAGHGSSFLPWPPACTHGRWPQARGQGGRGPALRRLRGGEGQGTASAALTGSGPFGVRPRAMPGTVSQTAGVWGRACSPHCGNCCTPVWRLPLSGRTARGPCGLPKLLDGTAAAQKQHGRPTCA